jgi:hypothetical protein
MDDTNIITRPDGRRYEYDSEFDVYRRIPEPSELTHMGRFGWIYACLLSIIIATIVTYSK